MISVIGGPAPPNNKDGLWLAVNRADQSRYQETVGEFGQGFIDCGTTSQELS